MKRDSYHIQKVLFWVMGLLAVTLAALLIHKGYALYKERIHQEELNVRNQEVQSEIDDMRTQIKELSENGEALQKFLDEKINGATGQDQSDQKQGDQGPPVQEAMSDSAVTDRQKTEGASEQGQSVQESASDSAEADGQQSEEASRQGQSVTENGQLADEVYGEDDAIIIDIPEKAKPQGNDSSAVVLNNNAALAEAKDADPAETISGNAPKERAGETISGNGMTTDGKQETISGNAVVDGQVIPFRYEETGTTLEEKRNVRSSYVETIMANGEDKATISNGTIDFSDMKIACLGDSLTAGDNMNDLEDYSKYAYPSVLKSILNAEEVYNLGIGGSSYGRYWDEAFVDRYKEIPEDSDIILVMGGTNDGFAASIDELGNINERKSRTFYGDVDELMRGLKENYPDVKIIFATPLPNILQDYLMSQRGYLLPQNVFTNAVKELAAEYGIDVIDLYNSNILDTHDSQIISAYMPDGVHGNPAGYQILAEHFASEIIRIMENDALYGTTVSGNSPESETISGNAAESTVSDNAVSGNDVNVKGQGNEEVPGGKETISAEELQQIEENNRKAADSAVIVTTLPAQGDASTPQTPPPSSGSEDNTKKTQETKNNYEYGGEAIIIN
ncbi:lysophospholipase L1-like esterase [Kineothrix alysoides]|uniref:Lysophospholipase L1-like esterase n=1 Tax=Kineothrix alysoides TaxID=1469948 RepID=A0A4R1R0V1_9FIRM|nr:SGNH/GDSL hydrolase family protein [Kineothrix alysoides]TCL58943.1 lysophospholipase L1-like esterase [Kineothrix alysoides]